MRFLTVGLIRCIAIGVATFGACAAHACLEHGAKLSSDGTRSAAQPKCRGVTTNKSSPTANARVGRVASTLPAAARHLVQPGEAQAINPQPLPPRTAQSAKLERQ